MCTLRLSVDRHAPVAMHTSEHAHARSLRIISQWLENTTLEASLFNCSKDCPGAHVHSVPVSNWQPHGAAVGVSLCKAS